MFGCLLLKPFLGGVFGKSSHRTPTSRFPSPCLSITEPTRAQSAVFFDPVSRVPPSSLTAPVVVLHRLHDQDGLRARKKKAKVAPNLAQDVAEPPLPSDLGLS